MVDRLDHLTYLPMEAFLNCKPSFQALRLDLSPMTVHIYDSIPTESCESACLAISETK